MTEQASESSRLSRAEYSAVTWAEKKSFSILLGAGAQSVEEDKIRR